MVTSITPADNGASWANVLSSRSMIRPPPYGPRSVTTHVAVAPLATFVTVTTVPRGSVARCPRVTVTMFRPDRDLPGDGDVEQPGRHRRQLGERGVVEVDEPPTAVRAAVGDDARGGGAVGDVRDGHDRAPRQRLVGA